MFFKHFFHQILNKRRIYLDYASSTPIDHSMIKTFPKTSNWFAGANPSALHKEGVALKKFLKEAKSIAAGAIGAQSDEIIFTSGATESDNLAIFGFLKNKIENGIDPKEIDLFVSPFEHSAVEESIRHLFAGININYLSQSEGFVLSNSLNIRPETKVVFISVIFVQNEIGTVQNIKEISKRVRKLHKDHPEKEIIFHTDATQAPLYYDLNVARLGIDMMTLGATKLYCPKGVGMLFKKRHIKLSPIFYGGGQELGLRPGTEPVDLIHKFAHALSYAQKNREQEFEKIKLLQEYFEKQIPKALPSVKITTHSGAQLPNERSPHITHLVIPNIDSELLVLELDARGIAVSSKSACKNDQDQDSGIMNLLYPNENFGAIRISYGRKTTKRELSETIKAIRQILTKYKINAII